MCESCLLKNEWNGKNVCFTLKMHVNKHREAHNKLVRALQFVSYEVPNGHTQVSCLIKSITSKDGAMLASITHIQGTATMRGDFESAADFLLLNALTPKEIERSYWVSAIALEADAGKMKKNSGIGQAGVELRYHSKSEYAKLSGPQRKELHEWRTNKKKDNDLDKNQYTSRISSLESQLKELMEVNKDMQTKISAISTKQVSFSDNLKDPLSKPLNQRGS